MDILISEAIGGRAVDQLKQQYQVAVLPDAWESPERLLRSIGEVRALIVRNQTQVTRQLINHANNLMIIARAGAGLDNVDTEAASQAGIVVSFAQRANSVSVAEMALGLMLALARKIPTAQLDTSQGGWARKRFTGMELYGKTLGIVGLGQIGEMTATRGRALGMNILAHDAFLNSGSPQLKPLEARLVDFPELLSDADVVSFHVPLTSDTKEMMNYERCRQMKSSALLINTSRGEVIDEPGLVRALQEGLLAGAALDVRGCEPPEPSSLDQMENVILTPHIAAFTEEAQERVVQTVCSDVSAVLRGEPADHYFNFALPRR